MHPVYLLAFLTFGLIIAYLVWNRISTGRHKFGPNNPAGLGGENDPIAGATDDVRHPDVLRASLDRASGQDSIDHHVPSPEATQPTHAEVVHPSAQP